MPIAVGKELVRVATMEWPGYTNRDGSGLYFDILHAVYPSSRYRLEPAFYPFARAQQLLHAKETDVLLVENDVSLTDQAHYSYLIIDVGHVDYLHLKNLKVKNESSLGNLKLGWVRGYNFENKLFGTVKPKSIFTVREIPQGILMVKRGHLDVFIDYEYGVVEEAERAGIKLDDCVFTEGFKESFVVAFSKNNRGQGLLSDYNKGIERIYKSGRLAEIYNLYILSGEVTTEQVAYILNYLEEYFSDKTLGGKAH